MRPPVASLVLFCLLIGGLLLCGPVEGQERNSDDPRCADYTCNTGMPMQQGFSNIIATCDGAECPRCFDGPEWAPRLAELVAGTAARSAFEPTLTFGVWLSDQISATLFRILAQEVLGFRVRTEKMFPTGFDVLCCDLDLFTVENWPTRDMPDDEGYFSLSQLPVGYEGYSGLFMPRYTVDRFPLATSFNAYKYLPEYQRIFPPGNSTACEWLLVNRSLGCVEGVGNTYCEYNPWTITTCAPFGRFIPPQCEADPSSCQEVYFYAPLWDLSFFEGLIRNTGLKFIGVYLGDNFEAKVMEDVAAGKDILFYGWEPDPLIALLGAQPIVFDPPSLECQRGQHPDPALSTNDCGYGKALLTKLVRRSTLAKDSDFRFFFQSFQVTTAQLNRMMLRYATIDANVSDPIFNISCEWLRDNFGTWKDWIRNTPANATEPAAPPGSSTDRVVLISVVGGIGVLLVLGAAGVYVAATMRAARAVRYAPRKPPMAVIFTDVENSTALWERHGSCMGAAIDEHNRIIRECIEEFRMYECKIVGDAFVIAGSDLVDAAMCCCAIQTRLMHAAWPAPLVRDDDEADPELFCGLRVRMGLGLAVDVKAKFDLVHGRYDVYGPDVNCAARVESVATGGQILMTDDTYAALVNDVRYAEMIGSEAVVVKFCSNLELKGVALPAVLYSMTPTPLARRCFDPIPGAVDELQGRGGDALDALSVSDLSAEAQLNLQGVVLVVTHILEQLPSRRDRDLTLAALLTAHALSELRGATFRHQVNHLARRIEAQLTHVLSRCSSPEWPTTVTSTVRAGDSDEDGDDIDAVRGLGAIGERRRKPLTTTTRADGGASERGRKPPRQPRGAGAADGSTSGDEAHTNPLQGDGHRLW